MFVAWFGTALGPNLFEIDDFRPDPYKFRGRFSLAERHRWGAAAQVFEAPEKDVDELFENPTLGRNYGVNLD